MRKSGVLLVAVALAVVTVAGGAHARPTAQATAADDVRELGASIEQIHPDPFRAVPRQRFRAEVNELARRAPGLDRNELLVGLLRVVALLGPRNGHTGIFPLDPGHLRQPHLYPVRLYDFADGVFVVDERGDLGLVGTRLVAVEGMPLAAVLARVRPLVPHDNGSFLRALAPHYLLVAEVLDGLGIVDGAGPATLTFERSGGERVEVELEPITAAAYRAAFADPLHGHYPAVLPSAPRPLYLASSARPLWTRTLAAGRAVYIGFNSVVPPAPAVLRRIEQLVRHARTRRVVVDVRLNGGGDNTTYGPLTRVLMSPRVDRRGRLYLLTGRATFSAAANFAAEVERDTTAIVVGEPTGGGVETYGDTVPVLLPTAGVYVHIAAEYHERRRGPRDRRLAVEPDVRVEPASADFLARRDPVLVRALRGL
jgi:hypothetical protein